jgi:hypothetical protein
MLGIGLRNQVAVPDRITGPRHPIAALIASPDYGT